jgi:hypothetical protein
MTTKRDYKALMYAGMMGHRYVLIHTGTDGVPTTSAELNDRASADRFAKVGDRLYEQHHNATTYRRTGCRFRVVKRYGLASRNTAKGDCAMTTSKKTPAAKASAMSAKAAKHAATSKTPKTQPKEKRTSGLDAAYQVLKAKGEPMSCQAIVDEMLTKGMWKTCGKTPTQTIYSALHRSIEKKAGESRFVKTGRGLFALAQ